MAIYRYTTAALFFILICAAAGCKMKSDVLATHKNGSITRGDLYEWLEVRDIDKKQILKKKSLEMTKLRQLAVEKLTIYEAAESGYEKSDEFRFTEELLKKNFYSGYQRKKVRDGGSFKEDAVKVRIIKLIAKNYRIDNNRRIDLSKSEIDAEIQKSVERAKELISQLDRGESFEDLAKKHSDDFSKRSGGDTGYIIRGMKGPDFSDKAFSLKKGEYTREPLRIDNSIYILKADDREELTEKNISKIIKDKNQADGLKMRLLNDAIRKYENNLMKAGDAAYFPENAASPDPGLVIYKIGEQTCRVGDLLKTMDFIIKKRTASGQRNVRVDDAIRKQVTEKFFKDDLIMRDFIRSGGDKERAFVKEWTAYRNSSLASEYVQSAILSGIAVTQNEIVGEYNKNRDSVYTVNINNAGTPAKKIMPLNDVVDRIRFVLLNKKIDEKRKSWETELIAKYSLVFNEEKLEGK